MTDDKFQKIAPRFTITGVLVSIVIGVVGVISSTTLFIKGYYLDDKTKRIEILEKDLSIANNNLKIVKDENLALNITLKNERENCSQLSSKYEDKIQKTSVQDSPQKITENGVNSLLSPPNDNDQTSEPDQLPQGQEGKKTAPVDRFNFSASDYKSGSLIPSPHIGKDTIIDSKGITSASDNSSATVKFKGFILPTPCKVEVSMSICKQCKIDIFSESKIVASVTTGSIGTHGNTANFEGTSGRVHAKNSMHVFEISNEGIRYFLNTEFIAYKNYYTGSIDEVVISGLKKNQHYSSYVFSVSGGPLQSSL